VGLVLEIQASGENLGGTSLYRLVRDIKSEDNMKLPQMG